MTENAESVLAYLSKFIKRNMRLIHVDLTNTGLSEKMLYAFGPALRRAKSLRSIHLSGNPGLSDPEAVGRVVDYLVKRAHCIKVESYNVIDFRNLPTNLQFSAGMQDEVRDQVYQQHIDQQSVGGKAPIERKPVGSDTVSGEPRPTPPPQVQASTVGGESGFGQNSG